MQYRDIIKYITKYERGEVTIEQISSYENSTIKQVEYMINRYYRNKMLKQKGNFNGIKRRKRSFNKKEIPIENYIEEYEEGEIAVEEIAKKYEVSSATINIRINEYYKSKGKERPQVKRKSKTKKDINIENYIKDYEDRKITIEQIANKEGVSTATIRNRLNDYYNKIGKERPIRIRKNNIKDNKENCGEGKKKEPKPITRKNIDIEKYIEDFENEKITVNQIAMQENVSNPIIYKKLDEYYAKIGKERPRHKKTSPKVSYMNLTAKDKKTKRIINNKGKKNIDIESYIDDYEKQRKTIEEIANAENVSVSTINKRVNEYYEKIGKERPKNYELYNINIDKYIEAFEEGKVTISQIAKNENVSHDVINTRIKKYYDKKGKKVPKIGASKDVIKPFLKRGMTREQIRKYALQRNVIILDSNFEKAEEEIKNDEINRHKKEIEESQR